MEHFIFSDLVLVVADESCMDQVRLQAEMLCQVWEVCAWRGEWYRVAL